MCASDTGISGGCFCDAVPGWRTPDAMVGAAESRMGGCTRCHTVLCVHRLSGAHRHAGIEGVPIPCYLTILARDSQGNTHEKCASLLWSSPLPSFPAAVGRGTASQLYQLLRSFGGRGLPRCSLFLPVCGSPAVGWPPCSCCHLTLALLALPILFLCCSLRLACFACRRNFFILLLVPHPWYDFVLLPLSPPSFARTCTK